MHGCAVLANDGEIGKGRDFDFHDDDWIIRYLVVDNAGPGGDESTPVTLERNPIRSMLTK